MENLVGREREIALLKEALASPEAELIAVYGRRRVGKTYLIRTVYEESIVFELTGANRSSTEEQLRNFALAAQKYFFKDAGIFPAPPQNWAEAFALLSDWLERLPASGKKVVFLDEFPWLDTRKSGFLAAFDHFWNAWASRQPQFVVVICGSAASWMIQNVVHNKGGLHNRITQRIRLQPFTLYEVERYLKSRQIVLSRYDILQLYMVTGGIPYYLKQVRPGESIDQMVDRLCFTKDGALYREFKDLYPALFGKADKHMAVIRALARKMSGLTRNEIITSCQLTSGGSLSKVLDELEESGFIGSYIPFGKTGKEALYKLTDEYSLFYLKFIENSKAMGAGNWQSKSGTQPWRSWRGFAFENICLKHIVQIKKALGISGVYTEQSVWRYAPHPGEKGVQIDLLIDRQDHCINLCEMKFYNTEYTLSREDAAELERKRRVFAEKTGTRKSIFITLITTYGATRNAYFLQSVQSQVTMDALFEAE